MPKKRQPKSTKKTTATRWYTKLTKPVTALWNRHRIAIVAVAALLFVSSLAAAAAVKNPPEEETTPETKPLQVQAVQFGQTDISETSVGQIKNLNTITLVAQSAGPVTTVTAVEGEQVAAGETILSQSSAYNAGNSATIARQQAGLSYQQAQEDLKTTQRDVELTKEQADENFENYEELKELAEDQIDDLKDAIEASENLVEQLEDDLSSDPTNTTLLGSLASTKGSLATSRQSLRTLEYNENDETPERLQEIAREKVYLAADLNLKIKQITKDIAWLSYKSAQIQEAKTRVSAPLAGTIEKLYVQPGEYVNPGEPVAVLRGDPRLCLVVNVAGPVAGRIDAQRTVTVEVNRDLTLELPITHVSSTPVAGQLYEMLAVVPPDYATQLYEDQSVEVTLPLYELSQVGGNYYVPLDAVFVTNTARYVFVEENGLAVQKQVETGTIVGNSIEIINGLAPGETVILDRRVIDQQPVEIQLQTGSQPAELG